MDEDTGLDYRGRTSVQLAHTPSAYLSLTVGPHQSTSLSYDTSNLDHAFSQGVSRDCNTTGSQRYFDGSAVGYFSDFCIQETALQSQFFPPCEPTLDFEATENLSQAALSAATNNRISDYISTKEQPWVPPVIVPAPSQLLSPYHTNQVCEPYAWSQGAGSSDQNPWRTTDSGYHSGIAACSTVEGSSYGQSPNIDLPVSDVDSLFMSASQETITGSEEPSASGKAMDAQAPKTKQRRGGEMTCEICADVLKCPSDYRKHKLKHEKHFTCDIEGCNRKEGFGTNNDLMRHKKSVHQIGLLQVTRTFKCAAPGCKVADKLWPRFDNFKQHLERMHKNADRDELLRRSELRASYPQNDFNRSRDQDLGGVGAGAIATVNPLDLGSASRTQLDESYSDGILLRDASDRNAKARSSLAEASTGSFAAARDGTDPSARVGLLVEIKNAIQAELARPNGATNQEDLVVMHKMQAVLESSTGNQHSGTSSSSDEGSSSSQTQRIPCSRQNCNKTFKRQCELNKHLKRHDRPWVCTAMGCAHRSGSRSDWQRHERKCSSIAREYIDGYMTHYRCALDDPSTRSGRCGFTHPSSKHFEAHLQELHAIGDQQRCAAIRSRSALTRQRPGHGWCGLCRKIVEWSPTGQMTKTEGNKDVGYGTFQDRADHIYKHIKEDGMIMDDWVGFETHLKRRSALRSNGWYPTPAQARKQPQAHAPGVSGANTRKRKAESDIPEGATQLEKKSRASIWICCQCSMPQALKLTKRCTQCDRDRCQYCEVPAEEQGRKRPHDAEKKFITTRSEFDMSETSSAG